MSTVLMTTARTFVWFDVSRVIVKNGFHKFAPRLNIYKYSIMGPEQLYLIIGFLLGCILMTCIFVVIGIFWYEWMYPDSTKDED